ncbi:MAG TPA: hypothetical protein G4N93_06355 [Dehalococcoidia bacterium]|nr:hypothetical protein [Dehalococcoidia bacterium]
MPGKSGQKHQSQSKKRKKRRDSSAITAEQPVSQTYEPVSQTGISAPSASVPTPKAVQAVASYPYIVTELRRIGILAGIILAVLVVLALALA